MINLTPSTKPDKGGTAVQTALTLDLSQLTPEDIQAYAVDALVVKWQAKVRRAGTIPTVDTYLAPKPGTRSSADPQTAARTLSVEALEKILAEKQAELAKPKTILRPAGKPGHDAKP